MNIGLILLSVVHSTVIVWMFSWIQLTPAPRWRHFRSLQLFLMISNGVAPSISGPKKKNKCRPLVNQRSDCGRLFVSSNKRSVAEVEGFHRQSGKGMAPAVDEADGERATPSSSQKPVRRGAKREKAEEAEAEEEAGTIWIQRKRLTLSRY